MVTGLPPEINKNDREFENESQVIIGLDAGRVRCGLARADLSLTLASPLSVIDTEPLASLPQRISAAIGGNPVSLLIAGLPLDHHGKEGPACEFARAVADAVAAGLDCPVEYVDERFTTVIAEQGRAKVVKGKRKPADIDAWAAAAILQSYLDRK